ncbi:hypothetical protein RclHR1_02170006 [Rhizophagus clarus]|uniref:Protein kinase domain-containing protein n=1 Tax=Rhizophagus clarus TaxID=94130 RepID=A0A2Z6QV10_9GLOM|nr:hypothetical protein RclHR1_02170006 [Rhizophagus clarus]
MERIDIYEKIFKKKLKWIPQNRFYDIKYIAEGRLRNIYRANMIEEYIDWICSRQRKNRMKSVLLKGLNDPNNFTPNSVNEITIPHEIYGITQDPKTKIYMVIWNEICERCNGICNTMRFEQNFENWTSEWIPYDRLYDFKYLAKDRIEANWIDGCIVHWDYNNEFNADWKRDRHTIVFLENLDDPDNVTLKSFNKIPVPHAVYGITQDPKTKSYMVVWSEICEKCKCTCNSIHFRQNFKNWTSGNSDIDKFIKEFQLSIHNNIYRESLEWIPYDRFCDIMRIEKGKKYRANWIDGCINTWDDNNQNWGRKNQNMFVILKSLDNPKNIRLEVDKIRAHEVYGITKDPKTNNYMVVLNDICEYCKRICSAIHFQRDFKTWTSGNSDIDNFIQNSQQSVHKHDRFKASDSFRVLEWVPYDRFYDIKYIPESKYGKVYKANWIDGYACWYVNISQRNRKNMIVNLNKLNDTKNITFEFLNEITKHYEVYGITQDPETKNYIVIWNEVCEKCKYICRAKDFQNNFKNWTSGNKDIDKFIQSVQMSFHEFDTKIVLKWIPYNEFCNIKYIARGGFGEVYSAERVINGKYDKLVALKGLNNSKNVTLEFMNEITLHNKIGNSLPIIRFYGITQDPETKNYMMVLEYAKDGNLRNYLNEIKLG